MLGDRATSWTTVVSTAEETSHVRRYRRFTLGALLEYRYRLAFLRIGVVELPQNFWEGYAGLFFELVFYA